MKVLGISAYYHDSAAALIVDGIVVSAVQEERLTRIKHDSTFPVNAIKYCLSFSNLNLDDLDAVVYYEKPFLKFERLIETYYKYAPRGVVSFVTSIPVWLREKLFLKHIIRKELSKISSYNKKTLQLLFTEHHQSHASSAFYPSGFSEAAILTVDGVGEWTTASVASGTEQGIELHSEMHFPNSLGLLYSAFTYFLGFMVNSGEYKLMGLAPYGEPENEQTLQFIQDIETHIVDVKDDGSIELNMKFFRFHIGLRMIHHRAFSKLFGIKRRKSNDAILQVHCNLAYAIQSVSENILLKMARKTKEITKSENLCLAGGVALNCVANGKLLRSKIFKNIYIQPAAGDAGGAVGAAFEAYRLLGGEIAKNPMPNVYLGPEYNENQIINELSLYKAVYIKKTDIELNQFVSDLLSKGNVIGWFQNRLEFGPRALGNRSILADPRNLEMQKKLNLKIKFREGFRPFAPTILEEYVSKYFNIDRESPYMLLVADVSDNIRKSVPENYSKMSYMEKLYTHRSDIQAVTHVDFSARIQTINPDQNPKYYNLLHAFFEQTGCPVVVNTSFNVRGEPIVCTPEEAYRCFMRTEMDYLVIGNLFFSKAEQPQSLNFNDKFKAD